MILVTGAAGFIGFHVSLRLLKDGHRVVGVDNLNAYYDPALKRARLKELSRHSRFLFHRLDVAKSTALERVFSAHRITHVVHLAAQAGVRLSLTRPQDYIDSNITGLLNVLEASRKSGIKHLVSASSSSVYGLNKEFPFSAGTPADHPVSLYGATKRSGELMAHAYSHLYSLPVTCLRFFTVYGPWGRPDMAYFSFTKAILEGRPIEVYGRGQMRRDFTYVDDVVEGVVRALFKPAKGDPGWGKRGKAAASSSPAPFRIYNIGNHTPVRLGDMIAILEGLLGKAAIKRFKPAQPGDVHSTAAEVTDLRKAVGFTPRTPLKTGLDQFVRWYRQYYG